MNTMYNFVYFVHFWLKIQNILNTRILHNLVVYNLSRLWDKVFIQKLSPLCTKYTLIVQFCECYYLQDTFLNDKR